MSSQQILNDQIYRYDPQRSASLNALHVLMTRFNMVLPGFRESGDLENEDTFNAWLQDRMRIFRDVCLRSILSQSKKPDFWMIGFDEARQHLVEPVLQLIQNHKWIIPVWQKTVNGQAESARIPFLREIENRRLPQHEWLITSRLDNDDALNRVFWHSLSEYAHSVSSHDPNLSNFWILFPIGAQYGAGDFRLFFQTNNAFLGRVERLSAEKRGGFATAMHMNHSRVLDAGTVFLPLTRYPMWLQFVHGNNVSNKINKYLICAQNPQQELLRFNLQKDTIDQWSDPAGLSPA